MFERKKKSLFDVEFRTELLREKLSTDFSGDKHEKKNLAPKSHF